MGWWVVGGWWLVVDGRWRVCVTGCVWVGSGVCVCVCVCVCLMI
jgi:hypothetical protein